MQFDRVCLHLRHASDNGQKSEHFLCKLQMWSFNDLTCSSIKPLNKDPHDSYKKHKDLPYDTTAPYQQEIIVAFPVKSAVSLYFLKHHCIISKKTCSFLGKASFCDVSCDHCILCKLWMSLQKLPTVQTNVMWQPPDTTFMPDGKTHVARRRLSLGVSNIMETADFVTMLQRLQKGPKHKLLLLLRARKQCCNVSAACLAEQSAHKNKEQERRSCFSCTRKEAAILQKLVKSSWGENLNLTISCAFHTFNPPLRRKQHWSCKKIKYSLSGLSFPNPAAFKP